MGSWVSYLGSGLLAGHLLALEVRGCRLSATVIPEVDLLGCGARCPAELTLCPVTTAGTILTSVQEVGSKTQLTCSLNSSGVAIVGHRWTRGGKVLQEDTLPGLQMKYM